MRSNNDGEYQDRANVFPQNYVHESGEAEVAAIIVTFSELVEWLQEIQGTAKDAIKRQVDRFKNKIKQLKDLNDGELPEQNR